VWEWLVARPEGQAIRKEKTAAARRMRFWEKGGKADFYAVDRVLTLVGLHPSELPGDVWLDVQPNDAYCELRRAA
jgi:hypothetical protein